VDEDVVSGLRLLDRALIFNEEERILLVADLHLGLDLELRRKGVTIPFQTGRIKKALLSLIHTEAPDRVVILGDVRHAIPVATRSEVVHVPRFLESIKKETYLTIIPGNHDAGIRDIVPRDVDVVPSRGMRYGDVGLFHGHTWPSAEVLSAETLICGHVHPCVTLTDEGGHPYRLTCWVTADLDRESLIKRYPDEDVRSQRLIIMPAFNPLITGQSLNTGKRPLGPLLRNNIAIHESLSYTLLDGTHLGRMDDAPTEDPG
jgi:hypothetical protein